MAQSQQVNANDTELNNALAEVSAAQQAWSAVHRRQKLGSEGNLKIAMWIGKYLEDFEKERRSVAP